ncbi:MAG: histidine kinase [Methylococcaceae bacterium]|nr:histidine kinase [Methylococcaceae bacterium]
MSLRYQLNIRIFLSSLCILILGGSIAIWQARNAVEKEVDSSINLALQLITFSLSRASQATPTETDWLAELNALKETRHLSIQFKKASGQIIDFTHDNPLTEAGKKPPQWFINLVGAQYPKAEHDITSPSGEPITLVIRANPLDEITEVWQETLAFFSSIFGLTLFTFLAVQVVFNKAIKAIAIIVNALKVIETGQYQQKLPEFSTQEYDSIAKAINHMTGVLNLAQQQNRALTQHSLEIQEDERQRLAQELHDELGQSLTAIKVTAITATHQKANVAKATESIISICDHLIKVVRSMMHQLHPLILTELGLKATLEDLLNHWSIRYPGLILDMTCPDEVDHMEQKITIQIFRVVQECLTNVVRHAQAKKVTVDLEVKHETGAGKVLRLEVNDDGQGCSAEMIKSGFGLLGMRERINSLGGEFGIQTQPGHGMRVIARIPLK